MTFSTEPACPDLFTKRFENEARAIERPLEAAVAGSELEPATTTTLAQVLLAAWMGNALHASLNEAKVQSVPLSEVIDQILAPYRPSASTA